MIEIARLLIAAEIPIEDAEDFVDAIKIFFKTKAPNVKHKINIVVLEEELPENGQKS